MSRRFQTSKYKNATPSWTTRESSGLYVRDLSVGSYNSHGDYVKSSAAYAAFNTNSSGSQLGVVPLDIDYAGTYPKILNAHSDLVTDFDFSPFEDGLLATCSGDATVKIWLLSKKSYENLPTLSPDYVTCSKYGRVDTVRFCPTSEYLLSYTSQQAVTFLDILNNKEVYHNAELHDETIMASAWSYNGAVLGTCCKDRKFRILDPRANELVSCVPSHDTYKDSRIFFAGDSPYVLTVGFDSSHTREVYVHDTRNFSAPPNKYSLETSTGILIPLFDPDTNMLFLAGRGDNSIRLFDFLPARGEMNLLSTEVTKDQTKGVCLLPKRALIVMEAEVNRLLHLSRSTLATVSYNVPRKSYIDFHADLYPSSRTYKTSGSAATYMTGDNGVVESYTLNPSYYLMRHEYVHMKPDFTTRRREEKARAQALKDEEEKYKKAVPEARPRKKSLSSSGSSSDEVPDSTVSSSSTRPIPRPRVSNNGSGIPFLRTPSSFITARRAADLSRGSSLDEGSVSSSGLPSYAAALEIERNANSANNNALDLPNYDPLESGDKEPTNGHSELNNGNSTAGDNLDGQSISMPDRRKAFEGPLESVSSTNGATGPEAETSSTRLSVADRLKMFQSKASDESLPVSLTEPESIDLPKTKPTDGDQKVEKSTGEKELSHSAPFGKPERKISPPSKAVDKDPSQPKVSAKRIDTVFGQVSKYRNFKAVPVHKKFHIENLRNISTTCPSESELIQANPERVAVPLNTPGGKVAIFELNKSGRQPDGVIPALVHGTKVMDFMWDPFDPTRLVVGCDDGRVCVWNIAEGGLKEQTNEPEVTIHAHAEKVYFVRFHPLAKDVLATGSYDLTIRIFDLSYQCQEKLCIQLDLAQIQIFCFAWSPCGTKFVTACKDGKVRIYEPRVQTVPLLEGKGPVGVRGGRVSWVLDGKFLVIAGFDRSSERQLLMYNCADLSNVCTVSLDVSPAILVPFYDEDSSILLLSGRGDSTIFAFDVVEEQPFLKQLSHHRCAGAHQGVSFLKKNACEVQNVEFARALRLTEYAVEPWSFTVPRVKSEFFQDDLFPPTKCLWEPTMTSTEWFEGHDSEPKRVSLKPTNMKSLGEISGGNRAEAFEPKPAAPMPIPSVAQSVTSGPVDNTGVKKQQEMLENAIKSKLAMNLKLEQDSMEGVDESEWSE